MKLLFDSCSLILLSKALVIDNVVETFASYTTQQVYDEVLKGKDKMQEDAFKVELLNKNKRLNVISSNPSLIKRLARDFNMGEGEASVIAWGLEDPQVTIVTDNKQGRKAARINKLVLVGSIEIVVSLCRRGKIHRQKAQNSLKILQTEGWFSQHLIDSAMEDLK